MYIYTNFLCSVYSAIQKCMYVYVYVCVCVYAVCMLKHWVHYGTDFEIKI